MNRFLAALVTIVIVSASCGGSNDEGANDEDGRGPRESGETSLTLLGPSESNAGLVPRFEWSSVDGADLYRLAVIGPGGLPIWAWEGDETSVYLGGLHVERPRGMRGPVVEAGSSWSVAAVDAQGAVIELSENRPVSPGSDSASSTTTTVAEQGPVEIGFPCDAASSDAVTAVVGPNPGTEPSELVVGGDLLGRKCGFNGGFTAPLVIGIFEGSASSFVDRCDICEEYAGLGDAAWGGIGDFSGRPVASLYVEFGGLAYTAESQGIEVTLEQLADVLRELM